MKIAVFGKDAEKINYFQEELRQKGFTLSETPEIVFSIGGDGSFLLSERKFPGIPKLAIRDKDSLCRVCMVKNFDTALEALYNKKFSVKEFPKIEAVIRGKKLIAANEIAIRNKELYHAIRFSLSADSDYELIGDGIVLATAFGSTGYFYSITKQSFEKGFGLAFNNTTTCMKPMYFNNPKVRIKILRNTAHISADNNPDIVEAPEGEVIDLRGSDEVLRVICPS